MNQDQELLEYVREWLDQHGEEYEDDTDRLYALSRSIAEQPALPTVTLVDLRKIYDAEKE